MNNRMHKSRSQDVDINKKSFADLELQNTFLKPNFST